MTRPRLDDPAEYAVIKKIYFNNDKLMSEEIDSLERLERVESKQRNNNKSSR